MLIDASADVVLPGLFTDPDTGESADPDANPIFRVFGADGSVTNGNGSGAPLETKTISAISTGPTTTVTSTAHGLATGSVVTIAGAAGTTGVNGTHPVTVSDANTFTFDDVSTSGTYTSGASWKTTGLFGFTLNSTIRAALQVGRSYLLVAYGVFSGTRRAIQQTFTVVN